MTERHTFPSSAGENGVSPLVVSLFSVMASIGLVGTAVVSGRQAGPLYFSSPTLSLVLPFLTVGLALVGCFAVGLSAFRRHPVILIPAYSFATLTVIGMVATGAPPARAAVAVASSMIPLVCIGFVSCMPRRVVLPWLKGYMRFMALLLGGQTLLVVRGILADYGLVNKDVLVISVGGSNYAAAFLLFATLFLLFGPWQRSWLDYMCIAVGFAGLVSTASLGGYVSFLIAGIVGACLHFTRRTLVRLLTILSIIAIGAWGLFASGWPLLRSLSNTLAVKSGFLSSGDTTGLLARRDELWEVSWLIFSENPWFGSSLAISLRADNEAFRAHNWLLELLSTRGLLTATVFTLMLTIVTVTLFRASRASPLIRSASTALLGVIIHGLVEPSFFAIKFDWVVWFVIAGVLACEPWVGVAAAHPPRGAPAPGGARQESAKPHTSRTDRSRETATGVLPTEGREGKPLDQAQGRPT